MSVYAEKHVCQISVCFADDIGKVDYMQQMPAMFSSF